MNHLMKPTVVLVATEVAAASSRCRPACRAITIEEKSLNKKNLRLLGGFYLGKEALGENALLLKRTNRLSAKNHGDLLAIYKESFLL